MIQGKPKNEDLIPISKVNDIIFKLTGVTRTRGTIYEWISYGRKGPVGQIVKLKIARRLGRCYTTETWVKKFIEEIG